MLYRKSESSIRPETRETVAKGIYFRKKIAEELRIDSDGNQTTYFVYDEAFVSNEEYEKNKEAIENSVELINLKENQTIIMEALAEIYEGVMLNG